MLEGKGVQREGPGRPRTVPGDQRRTFVHNRECRHGPKGSGQHFGHIGFRKLDSRRRFDTQP
jgi:hypothetical protein